MDYTGKKILVTGHTGFLGKRLIKRLKADGMNFITASKSSGIDFRDKKQTEQFFAKEKPEIIMNCIAYIGGIKFGMEHEGEVFYNNILMHTNLIEASRKYKIKRYINPISNCSYPDVVQKDFKESEWWDGPLHYTVFVYGFARKASWVQTYAYHKQYGMDFINLIIPNMYGPDDHFDEERSHALGALIMKIATAKKKKKPHVTVWGSGKPVREWLYVDDCVEAFIRSLTLPPIVDPINLGQRYGVTIKKLAEMIKKKVGYKGKLIYDTTRPDGAPYKIMNNDRMKKVFGWVPATNLEDGIDATVTWYMQHKL